MMNLFSRTKSFCVLIILGVLYLLFPNNHAHILIFAWVYKMAFSLSDLNKRSALLAFDLALFTFLMTRLVIPLFYTNDYIITSLDDTLSFNLETYDFMYTAIFIAMICVHVGFNVVNLNINTITKINNQKPQTLSIRYISKKICNITFVFAILEVLEKVYFVWTHSYLDYYLSYGQSLPGIIYKLSTIYDLVFYIFLATMPSKKDAKPVIIMYLILNTLSLLGGGRSSFILAIMFLVIYGYLRNDLTPDKPWISSKIQRRLLIIIPGVCMLMFIVMMIRGGSESYNMNVFELFLNFFFSQGSSMQVLGLTYEGVDSFPDGQYYSLGPLINVVNDNILLHMLGIGHHFKSQTVEIALNGHSLGNYLTYTYQTQRFFKGGGLGSSYIAEAWADFGYIGIIIWSLIYGVILAKIKLWCVKNTWITALAFMMMMSIIYAPRANAISFVSNLVSPTYLLTFMYIYYYSKRHS